jgi:hypothetical protein
MISDVPAAHQFNHHTPPTCLVRYHTEEIEGQGNQLRRATVEIGCYRSVELTEPDIR